MFMKKAEEEEEAEKAQGSFYPRGGEAHRRCAEREDKEV